MFSLKKTRKVYQSPRALVCEVDLECNYLLAGSEVYATIMADEFEFIGGGGEDDLGRGTATYLEQ